GRGGLRRRLTLVFVVVGLVPAAAGGILGIRQSLQTAQAARLESEVRLIALSAQAVAATLKNGLSIIRAAGEEEGLRRAVQSRDGTRMLVEVRNTQQHSADFASVLVLDARGVVLANSLDPGVVGQDVRERDYFQGVMRSRSPYISPVPYVGKATRVPTLAIAAPVWGPGREILGVVAGTFTLERLSQLLAPARAARGLGREQGQVYLVSPSGLILAHTDPNKRATQVAEVDAGARVVLVGQRGSLTWVDESGETQLSVFAPLPGIGWGLVYTHAYPSWVAAVPDLFPGLLPAVVVVLALAVVAGTLAARTLARPILDLQQAASRLRDGEFATRLPEDRRDELGDLAAAFNRMASALQNLYANLEAKVVERTATLKATNLELARASQVKSEFLARMSHDLRTPLNAVIGFADLLLTQQVGPLSDKQERYLGHVANAGRHLMVLINDILDLTRVEAGKLEIHPELCHVPTILEETLALFRSQALVRRITLAVEVGTPLGDLMADRIRLQQILHNLVSNAVKFTPEGGIVTV
ncbi:MAG: cache domain-containing protein, partial [candidate division NC10 bacterium]